MLDLALQVEASYELMPLRFPLRRVATNLDSAVNKFMFVAAIEEGDGRVVLCQSAPHNCYISSN
jgi:hypothetical protein